MVIRLLEQDLVAAVAARLTAVFGLSAEDELREVQLYHRVAAHAWRCLIYGHGYGPQTARRVPALVWSLGAELRRARRRSARRGSGPSVMPPSLAFALLSSAVSETLRSVAATSSWFLRPPLLIEHVHADLGWIS